MTAAALIAAIRSLHLAKPGQDWCFVCEVEPWPCPAAVAADRIEATYAVALVRARAALDGEAS